MELKTIKNITADSFSKYGVVIDLNPDSKDGWEIVVRAESPGWRIAVLEFSRKTAKVIENHPSSKESFEPVSGTALLAAAENGSPEDFEVFLLDRPVCLNEGIWHQVISLSATSKVKITENLKVTCEYFELENDITPGVGY